MSHVLPTESQDRKLVDSLLALKNDKFEVWKYFEERADRLGDQLWSTGIWLVSILAAALSLSFIVPGFIELSQSGFPMRVRARIPVALIAIFGMAFCVYAYVALLDLRRHIEGNWRRAAYARTGSWEPANWAGRKRHGWNVLLGIGILAFVGFASLLLLAFMPE
jgi:hypothetical protein